MIAVLKSRLLSGWINGFLSFCLYAISTSLFADSLALQKEVLISELKPPSPVSTLQGDLLVYELHIVNNSDKTLQLGLIEIMDEKNKHLTSYAGTKLQQNSFAYENNQRLEDKNIILKKGMGAFVTIWLSQPMFTHVPKSLNHHIWFVEYFPEKGKSTTQQIDYTLNVLDEKPVVLGNPLKGTQWVASAALSPTSYHRLTILPIEGKFYLAQRYAIDLMQICADGKTVHDDLHKNENWNGFGDEIYAVTDGVVSKVHENIKENTPPTLPVPQLPLNDIAGNHVIIKIQQHGKTYYVLNAHMQPGSIRVKEGDHVKKGQVIGLLGNTGNSSAPHLHLHVCDANDPLKCEGVPFVLEEANLIGNVDEIVADYGIWTIIKPLPKKNTKQLIPLDNQVFYFSKQPPDKCP